MYILGDLNCDMLRKDNEINTPTMTVKSLYEKYQLYQWTIPQLDKLLNSKNILAQLRAS